MEGTRSTKRKLSRRAKERRCAKKRKGFGEYKVDVSGDLEPNIDFNFEADVNVNIVGDDGDTPRNYFKAKTRLQRRKLGLLKGKQKFEAVGYKLMDVNLLKEVIAKSFICKFCKHAKGTINILEHMGGRKGLAECIIFICNYCSKETVMYTSKKVKGGTSTFDVNIRSTYASLPFGREGLAKFCSVMDLPPPVLR